MSILIKILFSYTQIYFRENKIYDSDVYESSSKIVKPIVPFKITINMISNIFC